METKLQRADAVVEQLKVLYSEGHDAALSTALKLLDETANREVTYTDEEVEMFRLGFRMMIRNRPQAKKAQPKSIKIPAYLVQAKKPYTEQFYDWVNGGKLLP